MKQIYISEILFDKILKSCKGSVAKDICRPELQFIRIEVKKDKITAYSLDGYRASRIIVPLKEEAEEEFIAFIRPFTLKVTPRGVEKVLLGLNDENAFVEFKTIHGTTRFVFDKPARWGVEMERVFEEGRKHDREVGVNAKYLSDACKAICATVEDRNNLSILESSENPLKSFCVRAEGEGFTTDQLILPVRYFKKED